MQWPHSNHDSCLGGMALSSKVRNVCAPSCKNIVTSGAEFQGHPIGPIMYLSVGMWVWSLLAVKRFVAAQTHHSLCHALLSDSLSVYSQDLSGANAFLLVEPASMQVKWSLLMTKEEDLVVSVRDAAEFQFFLIGLSATLQAIVFFPPVML